MTRATINPQDPLGDLLLLWIDPKTGESTVLGTVSGTACPLSAHPAPRKRLSGVLL